MRMKNWEEYKLNMDFSNIGVLCSDCDLIHMTNGGRLIIGELKNEKGRFYGAQRSIFAQIIDGYKYGGTVLYIVHDKDVHKGDEFVDVAECEVREYYWRGKWIRPKRFITVNEVLERLEEKTMGANIEGRAKVWAKEHEGGWKSYQISVSNKTPEGTWINAYQPVRFKKGVDIENGTMINYKGFATVVKGREHNFVLWQITEFEIVGEETVSKPEAYYEPITDNNIPF